MFAGNHFVYALHFSVIVTVAYRGSPAPGGQCSHRRPPPPKNLAFSPGGKIDKQKKNTPYI